MYGYGLASDNEIRGILSILINIRKIENRKRGLSDGLCRRQYAEIFKIFLSNPKLQQKIVGEG